VAVEISRIIQKDAQSKSISGFVFSGVISGMLMLWITGIFIK
jgi:hypothetical protein